jgi:hypothetical protein
MLVVVAVQFLVQAALEVQLALEEAVLEMLAQDLHTQELLER